MIGIIVKTYFYDDVVLINFVIMGIALTVSATLHAPFTAVFLTCGIFNNYSLILPLLIFVFVSFIVSKKNISFYGIQYFFTKAKEIKNARVFYLYFLVCLVFFFNLQIETYEVIFV
jgi:H+/Cl- antiporter ClcA